MTTPQTMPGSRPGHDRPALGSSPEAGITARPGGLWKTTIVIWSRYPGSDVELSGLYSQAEAGEAYCSQQTSVLISDPAADPAWDGTSFFGTRLPGILLLCDGCYQAATGLIAECEDGCRQDLDHTGLCRRDGTDDDACHWCATEDRLRQVPRAAVEHLLPTAGQENEGQWFLHWAAARQGPYPSEQAAWDAWHATAAPA